MKILLRVNVNVIGLLFLLQGSKQAKINHAILMYFNII